MHYNASMKQRKPKINIIWSILPIFVVLFAVIAGWIGFHNQEVVGRLLAISGICLGGIIAVWIVILSPIAGMLNGYCKAKDLEPPFWVFCTCYFWKKLDEGMSEFG